MGDSNGTLRDMRVDDSIRDKIVDSLIFWQPGQVVNNYLVEKFGILFLEFKSHGEMQRSCMDIINLIRPIFE
jgi:hypothetical protein